jgi:hypothetical protein
MRPGDEMDVLVAEKVFGHKFEKPKANTVQETPPEYSQDLEDAVDVVTEMHKRGYSMRPFSDLTTGDRLVILDADNKVIAHSEKPSEFAFIICKTALQLLGVKVD